MTYKYLPKFRYQCNLKRKLNISVTKIRHYNMVPNKYVWQQLAKTANLAAPVDNLTMISAQRYPQNMACEWGDIRYPSLNICKAYTPWNKINPQWPISTTTKLDGHSPECTNKTNQLILHCCKDTHYDLIGTEYLDIKNNYSWAHSSGIYPRLPQVQHKSETQTLGIETNNTSHLHTGLLHVLGEKSR